MLSKYALALDEVTYTPCTSHLYNIKGFEVWELDLYLDETDIERMVRLPLEQHNTQPA